MGREADLKKRDVRIGPSQPEEPPLLSRWGWALLVLAVVAAVGAELIGRQLVQQAEEGRVVANRSVARHYAEEERKKAEHRDRQEQAAGQLDFSRVEPIATTPTPRPPPCGALGAGCPEGFVCTGAGTCEADPGPGTRDPREAQEPDRGPQ